MKSLPGSQPMLREIHPKLVAGILGRSYDATPCVWLPFGSVFSSCPSLLLSLRLVLSFSLFLFLVLLLFYSVAPLLSSVTLLCFFFFLTFSPPLLSPFSFCPYFPSCFFLLTVTSPLSFLPPPLSHSFSLLL